MNPLRLLVLLTLFLSVVCNAELRTWTAVNGKEVEAEFVSNEKGIVKLKLKSGKVFEVPANKLSKEDNEFITSLAKPVKVNPKPEGVNEEELELREGIAYLKGSDAPYTGKTFILYKNGQKKLESNYKDGKQDGLATFWHENGQKAEEGSFKDGKIEGLHQTWYDNGQKRSEVNYKNGKKDGLQTTWYENGQKAQESNYKDGKVDGLAVAWYDNEQKSRELNYKDDKLDGLRVRYHKNGQKKAEENYKDGVKISGKYWNSKGEPVDTIEEARK